MANMIFSVQVIFLMTIVDIAAAFALYSFVRDILKAKGK